MTSKSFKSKIGVFLGGAYVIFVCVAVIAILTGPPDAMSGIAMMMLAVPWSFILFEALDTVMPPLPLVGVALYAFCVVLNAAILYVFGLAFSVLWRWIARLYRPSK